MRGKRDVYLTCVRAVASSTSYDACTVLTAVSSSSCFASCTVFEYLLAALRFFGVFVYLLKASIPFPSIRVFLLVLCFVSSFYFLLFFPVMSCVHYKYKNSLDYDTITFDGLHISLNDLRQAIATQKKIGKSSDFVLQVVNAQTNEGERTGYRACCSVKRVVRSAGSSTFSVRLPTWWKGGVKHGGYNNIAGRSRDRPACCPT